MERLRQQLERRPSSRSYIQDSTGTYFIDRPRGRSTQTDTLRLTSVLAPYGTATGKLRTWNRSGYTEGAEVDVVDYNGNWGRGASTWGEVIEVRRRMVSGSAAYEALSHGASQYGIKLTSDHPGKDTPFDVTLGSTWSETNYDYSAGETVKAVDLRANVDYPTASAESPIYGLAIPWFRELLLDVSG